MARDDEHVVSKGQADSGGPKVLVLIGEEADWDRPAALKLKGGKLAVLPEVTVWEAGKMVQVALEDGLLVNGDLDPHLVEHIEAHIEGHEEEGA